MSNPAMREINSDSYKTPLTNASFLPNKTPEIQLTVTSVINELKHQSDTKTYKVTD